MITEMARVFTRPAGWLIDAWSYLLSQVASYTGIEMLQYAFMHRACPWSGYCSPSSRH